MTDQAKKTKQHIIDTFIAMSLKQGIDTITVKALCTEADINRSTFYEYFKYIEEVIDEAIDRQFLMNFSVLREPSPTPDDSRTSLSRKEVSDYIDLLSEDRFVDAILRSKHANMYVQSLLSHQVQYTLNGLQKDQSSYYRAYFQNAGASAMVIHWLHTGKQLPVEELITIIQDYSRTMYQGSHHD